MKTGKLFQFRGVQLDLARQMEKLDFIFEFIDFIANAGYNTLVLYLEGRIKTKSFPYPAEGEYYTPEEMKTVGVVPLMLFFRSGVVKIKIPVVQEFFADDLGKSPDFIIGKL